MKTIKSISIALLIGSCCPDGVEIDRLALNENEKKLIPYNRNEDVKMIYSNGFEFDLNTDRRATEMHRTDTQHCGDSYSTYELLVVEMHSEIPEFDITLEVTPEEYSPYVNIGINRYYFGFNSLSEPDYEDLEVNGTNFKNVYVLQNQFSEDSIISPKEILYNVQFGIIQIVMTNEDKINLIP